MSCPPRCRHRSKQAAILDRANGDQAQGFILDRMTPAPESNLANFQRALPTSSFVSAKKPIRTLSSHRLSDSFGRSNHDLICLVRKLINLTNN
jgi:hypothetical protein